ncbi:MAG: DUF2269 family protein [Byssovorax cruenta]
MNWYNFFKFLHIVAVIVMIGGIFARQLVRAIIKKSNDPKAIASLTQVVGRLDRAMVIPGSNLVIVLGVIVALMLKWPIFGFLQGASQNWLLLSNILLVVAMLMIPIVFLPHNRKVESLLQVALTEGRVTPELHAILNDPTNRLAHALEEIIVVIIAALMVLKPF